MGRSSPPTEPAGPAPQLSVLDAIEGSVRPPRASILYVAAMFVVAATMIALPICYLALIAAVGYGVYYHMTHNTGVLTPGAGARGRLVLFLTPIMVGVTLILFMVKPLFAPRRRSSEGLVIDAHNEPLLPQYVEKLCRAVGAPVPSEIRVNCDVNASASFRRGFWGVLTNDLTLTIGMPLVAGLTLRELSGVLAHEFGHFTQRVAMRLSFVIRSVSAWFARVVYERDKWDEQLVAGSDSDSRAALFLLIARLCVWLTRRVLWVLMMIGHGISCLLLRQMEYNADRCEALVAGSDAFERTLRKFSALNACASAANNHLGLSWRDGKLVDDLPALMVGHFHRMPVGVQKLIDDSIAKSKSGLFDTHPCDRDRLQYIRRHPAEGIVQGDRPARDLFRNFDVICKAATLVFYREAISPQVGRQNLITTQQLTSAARQEHDEREAIPAYLGHELYPARPVFLDDPYASSPADSAAVAEKLKEAHRRIRAALPKIREAYKQFDEADDGLISLSAAKTLLRADLKIKPKDFGLDSTGDAALAARQKSLQAQQTEALRVLVSYEKVLQLRMTCALQLLSDRKGTIAIPDRPAALAQAQRMIAVFSRLREILSGWHGLRVDFSVLLAAAPFFRTSQDNGQVVALVETRVSKLLGYVRDARQTVRDLEYPFDHATAGLTLSTYLLEYVPSDADLQRGVDAVETFGENVVDLYLRVLARLTAIAARAETAIGLTPMPPEKS